MAMPLKACLMVALMLAANDPDPEPPEKAPPRADVRGEVKSVIQKATKLKPVGVLRVEVEGVKEKDTQYDKAVAVVRSTAKVYKWVNGKKKDASLEDIKVGSKVQCLFKGPVADSYPVQGEASEVLILPAAKKK